MALRRAPAGYNLRRRRGGFPAWCHCALFHLSLAHVVARYRRAPRLPDLVENGRRYVQTAWPQAQSRDDRSRCVGCLMSAVVTKAAGAMAIAGFLSNGPADTQRTHDGFPTQLLRRNGVRAERFALLQARANQILKEAGSRD